MSKTSEAPSKNARSFVRPQAETKASDSGTISLQWGVVFGLIQNSHTFLVLCSRQDSAQLTNLSEAPRSRKWLLPWLARFLPHITRYSFELRLSSPGRGYKTKIAECLCIQLLRFVLPPGLEPGTTDPKSVVISVSPRERGTIRRLSRPLCVFARTK